MRRWNFAMSLMAALAGLGMAMGTAQGQALGIPLGVDVRGEVAFPMGDFGDVADTGTGFSAGLSVGLLPGVGVYGKYSELRFGGDWTGEEGSEAVDSGWSVGASAALSRGVGLIPWVGAGLLFHDLEVAGSREGISTDMGFELGGGVLIPLTGQLRLSPAVNYRHYRATVPVDRFLIRTEEDLTVQHLSLSLGLSLTF